MPQAVDNWLQFSPRQPKRKRADCVCFLCHSKKVKCDLQEKLNAGKSTCSSCESNNNDCQIRPSKRSKHGKAPHPNRERASPPNSIPATVPDPSSDKVLPRSSEQLTSGNHYVEIPAPQNAPVNICCSSHYSAPAVSDVSSLQQQRSGDSSRGRIGLSHAGDVDTGFLQVYTTEHDRDAEEQDLEANADHGRGTLELFHDDLVPIFSETYLDFCYAFCPVIDPDMIHESMTSSPLLANAVALAASNVRPPLMPHAGCAEYYKRAKEIFYNDGEADSLTTLQALCLFYWWAPRPPSTAHRHSSWWWSSIIIRIAQQMDVHRERVPSTTPMEVRRQSIRRRVWWTAYARERLTALCQSKPCIIDSMDCTIGECQLSDFPNDPMSQKRGEIFIYWVRLCSIIGKIAQHLSRTSVHGLSFASPSHYVQELADWVHSLPPHLQLPIKSAKTTMFDRDVYQLHLPYLVTIIVLHLRKSSQHLPQAFPPAILAASCMARILRDILSRGDTRFLMAITCWYTGTAYIALLQAAKINHFAREACEGLDIFGRAAKELSKMWGSARIICEGFERLRKTYSPQETQSPADNNNIIIINGDINGLMAQESNDVLYDGGAFDWTLLFPFVTSNTSRIAELLLSRHGQGRLQTPADSPFREAYWNQYQDLLQPFGSEVFDFFDTMVGF